MDRTDARHPMRAALAHHEARGAFRLEFRPLRHSGRVYMFPCDEGGRVDIDALGERARNEYFFARAVVGRDFTRPRVRICDGSCIACRG